MDVSRDAEELRQFAAEVRHDHAAEHPGPGEAELRSVRKKLTFDLNQQVKEYLSRLATASGTTFAHNCLINGFELTVSIGDQRIPITVVDGENVDIRDPRDNETRTLQPPFWDGIRPILMAAVKQAVNR